jgi:hypothetical protein
MQFFTNDVVVIVLDNKLQVDPAPIDENVVSQPGLRLTHVAYPADHRFMPWVHFDCRLLRSDLQGSLWFNDCDTHPGSSGGPVLTHTDGTYKLAAIMVGSGERLFNIALPVSEWLDPDPKRQLPLRVSPPSLNKIETFPRSIMNIAVRFEPAEPTSFSRHALPELAAHVHERVGWRRAPSVFPTLSPVNNS